jgi:hypothetical protein
VLPSSIALNLKSSPSNDALNFDKLKDSPNKNLLIGHNFVTQPVPEKRKSVSTKKSKQKEDYLVENVIVAAKSNIRSSQMPNELNDVNL